MSLDNPLPIIQPTAPNPDRKEENLKILSEKIKELSLKGKEIFITVPHHPSIIAVKNLDLGYTLLKLDPSGQYLSLATEDMRESETVQVRMIYLFDNLTISRIIEELSIKYGSSFEWTKLVVPGTLILKSPGKVTKVDPTQTSTNEP